MYCNIFFILGGKLSGEFDAVVSDGVNTAGPFVFIASYKEASVTLLHSSGLHVFPLLRKAFSPSNLLAQCSDPSRTVTFIIKSPPSQGHILVEPNTFPAYNFTQNDVNHSRVWYQHMKPFTDRTETDSFVFDVSAAFTQPLLNQVCLFLRFCIKTCDQKCFYNKILV